MKTMRHFVLTSMLYIRLFARKIGKIFSSEEKRDFERLKDYIAS